MMIMMMVFVDDIYDDNDDGGNIDTTIDHTVEALLLKSRGFFGKADFRGLVPNTNLPVTSY